MASEINEGKIHTVAEMTLSSQALDKKLVDKKPMSRALKATICGVIGAVIGVILGFAIGAAVTCWGGGFGSLPAAICGGVAGFTIGQGLIVGGAALGAGTGTGALSAVAGFFSAKNNNNAYAQKQREKEILMPEIDSVYQVMGVSRR